jgi:drug/metabolite transporter (DMT)-like permease
MSVPAESARTFPPQPAAAPRFGAPEAALVAVTMVWGATFLIVQAAMSVSGPLFFVGIRFTTAALATGLIALPVLRGVTRREIVAGAAIGVAIFLGYTLQTWGLKTIESSKSGFITALYVPLVPLLQWLVLRRPPRLMSWIGIACAFTGLVLLAGPDGTRISFTFGEILTVIAALAFACEILLIGGFARSVDLRRVTVIQLAVTALIAFALMPAVGEEVPEFSWLLVACACGMGMASAVIQLAMNWAQKRISPTRATLIYAAEPVWAGVFGRLAGERLPVLALAGAALIVAGVIVSELRLPKKKPR